MIRLETQSHALHPCLLILVCGLALASSRETDTENDRQALLCFKSQLSDPAKALSSWSNTSKQFCNWHGVTCTAQSPRRVTAVDLISEGLIGSISSCISNLTSLTRLQLSDNSFNGAIPSNLGLLINLSYLNLSMNSLSGEIPSGLSSCAQLGVLSLWNNSLQGEIPQTLSRCINIREINLSNNKLQGSIPVGFGTLPKLETLILAGNSLFGNIPPSLGGSSSLIYVDLGGNSLTGEIPESLGNSSSLQVLRLMSNRLTGKLPEVMFNSLSLTTICLQKNIIVGSIPQVTTISSPLKYLSLIENGLSGQIPSSLGNLSSLILLDISFNNLVGSIPESLGHILRLETLKLNINNLSGLVPPSLYNMSSLKILGLANNSLIGTLPSNMGYSLPNIQKLIFSSNRFHGEIPTSLINASQLEMIYIYDNSLTGLIPSFGSLKFLTVLDVGGNMLEAGNWGFLSSLSNCSGLTTLMIDSNSLQGSLPLSIGSLPLSLERLWFRVNKISGPIPMEIGNLKNLTELIIGHNLINGSIPPTLVNLRNLVILGLGHNNLSGHLPDFMGNFIQLNDISLEVNNLNGSIPTSIGHCRQLSKVNLSHNSLVGSIPSELFKISSLTDYLDLSHNHLSGEIPEEVGNLINLNKLVISNNRLSGKIPSTLSQCVLLESLQIQSNFLEGSIPQSFTKLVGMKEMDLSHNNLSGEVPSFLASMSNLLVLNLSFNNFEGMVPQGGIFSNGSIVLLEGNNRLCSSVPALGLPICSKPVDHKRRHYSLAGKLVTLVVIACAVLSCLLAVMLKRKKRQSVPSSEQSDQDMKRITFQDIAKATNQFSFANLVGAGSFGSVYKGSLELEDNTVAIKVFNLNIFGANMSFNAECETLKNIRHRNLVKVITSCSSVDLSGNEFKALIYKYMPNGNLEMWLHHNVHEQGQRKTISLSQRINIALDVALALDYLHNQCGYHIVHCDLKPSNILLDLEMTACVGDFGLARFLCSRSDAQQIDSATLARLKGSIGYIAPEYGVNVAISTKGDVYSFGVLLLEMITGNRPTDQKFNDGITLHDYISKAWPNNISEIVDRHLMLQNAININDMMHNCIVPLVQIGLSCSMASPKARPEMEKVCSEILAIKHAFSSINVI